MIRPLSLGTVLADANASHLGRFAVDEQLSDMGAFKTPTLRNIALTAPYMHDGSIPSCARSSFTTGMAA